MRSSQGYTLMEMMVVVTIMAIMAVIAVPKYQQVQAGNKISVAANALAADLARARSEAVVRRSDLHFVAAVSNTGNPWGGGWKIQDQALGNDLFKNTAVPPSTTIKSNPVLTDVVLHGVSGMTTQVDNSVVNIEFIVCDSGVTGEVGRSVFISQFGRVAVKSHANSTTCN